MCAKKAKSSSSKRRTQKSTTPPSKKRVVTTTAAPKAEKTSVPPPSRKSDSKVELPFTRKNYMLLLIGVGMIALGFFLMSLDDFVDASKFSISLYIAPPIVVAGFLEIIYAIMYKDKTAEISEDSHSLT